MLFFVICACFALFPKEVVIGAQSGLALCINAVIPSLLPFMLISSCMIRSGFSRPIGVALSKILTPLTGMSSSGCVCFVTGLLGGFGTGIRAVSECYEKDYISKNEAESLIAFCNNAGILFVTGTVGISFFSSKTIGMMLFGVEVLTALICGAIFSQKGVQREEKVRDEWEKYKKNKPSIGELVSSCSIECGGAIASVCIFVITFSAILEIFPMGKYSVLSGILEVTRGCAEASRMGRDALPLVSAMLYWGGMSVHLQASALSKGKLSMKKYYPARIAGSALAYFITMFVCADINIFAVLVIVLSAMLLIVRLFRGCTLPRGFRLRRHS